MYASESRKLLEKSLEDTVPNEQYRRIMVAIENRAEQGDGYYIYNMS